MRDAALVLGGSRGLGRAVAERLASRGADVIVSARESTALRETAAALTSAGAASVTALPLDVAAVTSASAAAFVRQCLDALPSLAQVYITVGANADNDAGTASSAAFDALMAVNATGICHLAAAFTEALRGREANITVVSSVAAVRGRKRNLAYAAAKRALETYMAGLRHEVAGGPLRLQVIRAGYIRSRLSDGKQLLLTPADPVELAALMVEGRRDDFGVRYAPRAWALIALVLRLLPWPLFRRLNV